MHAENFTFLMPASGVMIYYCQHALNKFSCSKHMYSATYINNKHIIHYLVVYSCRPTEK
jgi:hypothetical protein